MEDPLLTPLIKQLERSGETRDLALARVLECSSSTNSELKKIDFRLSQVEEQTKKTNGRVNVLEEDLGYVEEQKDELIKEVSYRKRTITWILSAVTVIFTTLGIVAWEKFAFLLKLDEAYLKQIVQLAIAELVKQ